MNKGENEKVLFIMKKVCEVNLDDINLMCFEVDFVYKMGDMEKYNSIMVEVIKIDLNNLELYYNFGVSFVFIG